LTDRRGDRAYGSDLRIQLDLATTERATETIGSHASRGGWVTGVIHEGSPPTTRGLLALAVALACG
jgi:hypothetical protein